MVKDNTIQKMKIIDYTNNEKEDDSNVFVK